MMPIEFPLLLAGPILRRVEPARAFIWVATSKRIDIKAKLYLINHFHEDISYEKIPTKTNTTSIKLGNQLFIHLISINPEQGHFPTDSLLGYNLLFTTDSSQTHDLGSLGHLTSETHNSITYGRLKYPTFYIRNPQQPSTSNLVYGSCRKLHGEGDDTLALADTLIENDYLNLQKRPDSLVLMGDQIYADDVADPIFRTISTLSEQLMGQHECFEKIDPRLEGEPYRTSIRQINGRKYIMDTFCQFTSGQSQNHLMVAGEYAAMYLLAFSPEIWETAQIHDLFESFDEAVQNGHVHFAFKEEERTLKKHKSELKKLKARYTHQQEMLISFQQTLPKVRRLLANIPTYMIFDDHDITDDWNISESWKRNVRAAPLGKHVVANGLAAYWAFQGWGNDPDSFSRDFIEKMTAYFQNQSIDPNQNLTLEDFIWDYHSWHFVSPTIPKSLFLDSRTQREYQAPPKPVKFGSVIDETDTPPQLLSSTGWEQAAQALFASGWSKNTPLIIVTATPVYGMGLIESTLYKFVYPLKVLGVETQTKGDFEAWKYNGEGFTEFLKQAAEWSPSLCIILSGDVHYASAVKAKVTFQDKRELNIRQFTSSPFKNISFTGIWGLLMKLVITKNVRFRKDRDLYRYCSPRFEIIRVDNKEETDAQPFLWKDELRYQFLYKDSIMETENNLGLLTIKEVDMKNTLLKNTENKQKTE